MENMNYMLTDNATGNQTLFETQDEARGAVGFDRLRDYQIDYVDNDGNLICQLETA